MPKFLRKKPRKNQRHMKTTRRSYIPKRLRYVDEYHTKMTMNSNGAQAFNLSTPGFNDFNSVAITFLLRNLINFGDWEKLFEEVRLNKVHIKFRPGASQVVAQSSVNAQAPLLPVATSANTPLVYYLVDRNDAVPEPTASDFKECARTVSKVATKPHSIMFSPSTLSPIYAGLDINNKPVFTYSVDYEKKWLQLNNAITKNTIFYGVKYGIEGSDVRQFNMTVEVDCYVSFRGKRE